MRKRKPGSGRGPLVKPKELEALIMPVRHAFDSITAGGGMSAEECLSIQIFSALCKQVANAKKNAKAAQAADRLSANRRYRKSRRINHARRPEPNQRNRQPFRPLVSAVRAPYQKRRQQPDRATSGYPRSADLITKNQTAACRNPCSFVVSCCTGARRVGR